MVDVLTADQQWVANAFLRELLSWRLTDTAPPLHVVDRRMILADMVLAEVEPDDLLCLSLRGLASAAIDLCLWPKDFGVARRYVAARWAYLNMFWSAVK